MVRCFHIGVCFTVIGSSLPNAMPTQLHSRFQTVMQRRGVPAFMILINAIVLISLLVPRVAPLKVIAIALAIQVQVGLIYYLVHRSLVAHVVDAAVLEDGVLHVRRSAVEIAVPAAQIVGMRGRFGINPETITLDLAEPTALGSSVTFIPPGRFPSTKDHPMMTTLRQLLAPSVAA